MEFVCAVLFVWLFYSPESAGHTMAVVLAVVVAVAIVVADAFFVSEPAD